MFFATAAMMIPTENKTMMVMKTGFLPKTFESEKITGWRTHDVRRKDVPTQKDSRAVPFRSWEMICTKQVVSCVAWAKWWKGVQGFAKQTYRQSNSDDIRL